jgi:hypothetical protein
MENKEFKRMQELAGVPVTTTTTTENVVTENSYSAEGYSIFNSEYDDSIGIAHDSAEDTMVVLSLDPNVDFGETAVDNGTIKLGNKLVYWAVTTG